MHPEDIEDLENLTPGERTVFRFLREAARPDSDFIGWYEPAIGEQGREPDFVSAGADKKALVGWNPGPKERIGFLNCRFRI
jgi:hypothetical protein